MLQHKEGGTQIRTEDGGFAGLCLTTWLCRLKARYVSVKGEILQVIVKKVTIGPMNQMQGISSCHLPQISTDGEVACAMVLSDMARKPVRFQKALVGAWYIPDFTSFGQSENGEISKMAKKQPAL